MFQRYLLLLILSSLGTMVYGAFGLNYDHERDRARAQEAYFVPVNASVYRLRQPDGVFREFVRDADERNLLHGTSPWVAELDDSRALVMTDSGFKGGQTGFMFLNGCLRRLLVDGHEYSFAQAAPSRDPDRLSAIWPPVEKRLVADAAPDVWKDGKRLRLWFDNPNKAGLLFAELALAALALVFIKPLWVRILGGAFFLPAFVGLVMTSSRGGFLAFLCGLGVVLLTRIKALLSWRRLAILALVVAVAVGSLFALGQAERLGKNLFREGQRETSRLTVWREVPRMMVDAPWGWGLGESGRAYIDWYQEKSECLLKNLISGHLTFLVEVGWPMRFAYIFLWAFLIVFATGHSMFKGSSPIPASIFSAFFVAACFNPVVQVLELWIVPLFAIGIAGCVQWRKACGGGPLKISVLMSLMGAVVVVLGVIVAGESSQRSETICRVGGAVCLKSEHPDIWLVDDDYSLHGGYWWMFGQELRSGLKNDREFRAIAYLRSASNLPAEVEKVVLVGEEGRAFLKLEHRPKAKQIVFISPPFSWEEVPAELLTTSRVRFVVGGLSARYMGLENGKPDWVTVVPGALLYIPDWMAYLK